MNPRPLLRAALLAGALPALAAAQDLTTIPSFFLNDIGDGLPLVACGADNAQAARWTEATGVTYLGPGVLIVDTSADEQAYLGRTMINGDFHATRWTAATGWVPLPQPTGTVDDFLYPSAMSDDGTVAVGFAGTASPIVESHVAWRWTLAGGTELLDDVLAETSRANCVSADGSWVGGMRYIPGVDAGRASRWNTGGAPWVVLPESFPGVHDTYSELSVLNHDGSRGAGRFGSDVFVWESPNIAALIPRPPGDDTSAMIPVGMADDGGLIAGYCIGSPGEDPPSWFWTPNEGTRWVHDVAAQLGLDLGDATLPFDTMRDCSADGLRLAGTHPTPTSEDGWVLHLPPGGVGLVVDLKKSLAGDTTPALDALGSFGGGTDVTLQLRQLKGLGTTTHLVIGLTKLGLPFKGGTMVPNPDIVVSFAAMLSKIDITLPWPAGVPTGSSLYFQVWQQQPGGPLGWAASNALQVVTP